MCPTLRPQVHVEAYFVKSMSWFLFMLGISKMECQRSSVLWVIPRQLRESQKSDSEIYEKLPLFQIEEQWGKTDAGKNLVRIALIYIT